MADPTQQAAYTSTTATTATRRFRAIMLVSGMDAGRRAPGEGPKRNKDSVTLRLS